MKNVNKQMSFNLLGKRRVFQRIGIKKGGKAEGTQKNKRFLAKPQGKEETQGKMSLALFGKPHEIYVSSVLAMLLYNLYVGKLCKISAQLKLDCERLNGIPNDLGKLLFKILFAAKQ